MCGQGTWVLMDDDDEQQVLTRDGRCLVRFFFLLRGVRAEMRCSIFPNYQARGGGEQMQDELRGKGPVCCFW